jgi:hypothetical protein
MNYIRQQITASGLNLDNISPIGQAYNVLAYTTAPVTLLGNVVINPTITVGFVSSFSILWESNLSLSTFSVVMAGMTIPQDQVNQTGTFDCYYDGAAWSVQYFADGKDQPQAAQGVTDIPVPVGGTKTLEAGVDTSYQRLTGPRTLTSNYTVTASTTGIKAGSQFQIEVAGNITLDGNSMTVFDVSINENQASNGGVIIFATFDGTNWVAASTSKPITTADIEPIIGLSVMGNSTDNTTAPTDIEFVTDFGVLHRNGNTLTTGLLTSASFDPTSIVANRVSVVTLTSAQILASNTPIVIVPSSGLNTVNVISSITVACTFGTTAYTGNTDVSVYYASGSDNLFIGVDLWGFATSGVSQLNNFNAASQSFQYVANADLLLRTDTSNPTGGNGTAKITVIYQTISL